MKFNQIKKEYYAHTGKASDVMRQLSYAGLGAVWVFKIGQSVPVVPRKMIPAALFFVLALLFDLLQYLSLSVNWKRVATAADQSGLTDEDEYVVDDSVNRWGVRFYSMKAVGLLLGYSALILAVLITLFDG